MKKICFLLFLIAACNKPETVKPMNMVAVSNVIIKDTGVIGNLCMSSDRMITGTVWTHGLKENDVLYIYSIRKGRDTGASLKLATINSHQDFKLPQGETGMCDNLPVLKLVVYPASMQNGKLLDKKRSTCTQCTEPKKRKKGHEFPK